ncbi:2-phosphosulfolactate phosphatase [Janibacter cremeus]|uniref:2-phosphosulfolactate phosphatase n=1 Tax=Janibacter cremeus TaxID=1285192 RepID=UPI0031B58F90
MPPLLNDPVVVIDVLRAFTTSAWVLSRRPAGLSLSPTRIGALRLKAELGAGAVAITDGELSEGFDMGNSPGQARRFPLQGRPVVQVTSNGTVGVHAARHAPLILCASLANASATARAIRASGSKRVIYVVTGNQGTADEDLACADLIHAQTKGTGLPTDSVERVRGSAAAHALREDIAACRPGVSSDDVDLACEIDRFDFALITEENHGRFDLRSSTSERGRWLEGGGVRRTT